MREKLTASFIERLKCPDSKTQFKVFDSEVSGLAVRVTKNGIKTFIFERRPKGGKLRQEKIGRCGEISVDQARGAARRKAVEFDDPNYVNRLLSKRTQHTFGQAFELYASTHMPVLAKTTREKQRGLFDREVLPRLNGLALDEFTRQHLSGITLPIQQRGNHGTASGVWKAVSAFLTWCVRQGLLDVNPVLGATPKFNLRQRDRVLSIDEIREIWRAADVLSEPRRAAVRLLLLLPFRKTEFTTAQWQEFDGEYLHIPAERTKSRRPISIYISAFARSHFPKKRNDSDFIFTIDGRVPTRMDDKLLKRVLDVSGVKKFGWHDNRHTFSSHMNDRQSADFIAIEACLNHVVEAKKGIAGVYNHATYAERSRLVMQQWSDIVEAAVVRR